VFLYIASFAAMVIGNVVHERGITQYIVVQTAGLILMTGLTLFPFITHRRDATVATSDQLTTTGNTVA
jgi:hypothetical protein